MRQGRLELRSGSWEWHVQEPEAPGGEARLRLRPPDRAASAAVSSEGGARADEMVVPLRGDRSISEDRVRALATHAPVRRFEDADRTVWTAEVKAPRLASVTDPVGAPMVLFSSDRRACLVALRPVRGLGELTTDELRALLRTCLEG